MAFTVFYYYHNAKKTAREAAFLRETCIYFSIREPVCPKHEKVSSGCMPVQPEDAFSFHFTGFQTVIFCLWKFLPFRHYLTMILIFAVFLLKVFTVMTAVPFLTAFTFPFEDTVATDFLPDL